MDRRQPSATKNDSRPTAPARTASDGVFRLSKGLDLPITGEPTQQIDDSLKTTRVALVGPDYNGMRPTMEVEVGDRVKACQVVFSDKKTPGVVYTAPGAGTVTAINRGRRRAFLSVEIRLDGDACEAFPDLTPAKIRALDRQTAVDVLVRSGFWTAFRTRPFSKVPPPDSTPDSIFVTAIDTNPLAADPAVIVGPRRDDFEAGLSVLTRLGAEHVFLCKAAGVELPGEQFDGVETTEFAGPHPAGLPGTHIHFLAPVDRGRTAWHLNYQDVLAIGRLFLTGRPDFERVVSLAGPGVVKPRLARTRIGANLTDLTRGQLTPGVERVVSGSVLCGRKSEEPTDYLGRYHLQISVLPEAADRELFGWIMPGFNKFSLINVVASKLLPGKRFALDTSRHGGGRAIVPMDMYEKVMPLDILPTFLFKALAVGDLEQAEALGCLELDEEDLALCTFVCPGKGDYGVMLRENLTVIEKEG
ncbi:MAG: Na(+)-translocating NADH-quinone reductase subunit A [Pirellulaceae bacterium]|nr:Na(+)-translocating NADH-quinone reductase subunit A [Pirellulaceae bacterium]